MQDLNYFVLFLFIFFTGQGMTGPGGRACSHMSTQTQNFDHSCIGITEYNEVFVLPPGDKKGSEESIQQSVQPSVSTNKH